MTDLFGQERVRLNQIRYALGNDSLPFNKKAADAVEQMLANRQPPSEVPDEDLGGLQVSVLRSMLEAKGIETKTGKKN